MFGIDLLIPGMTIAVLGAFFALVATVAKNYVKVPPNRVAIFYGKSRNLNNQKVGFRVVTGGSRMKIPILESVQFMDLNVFSIPLHVKGAPNKDGVRMDVKGVATVKIQSDEVSLMAACERFLGKEPKEIQDIAFNNLEGHLRAIVGRLSIEDFVSDRQKLNQEILNEAGDDLRKIGLGVDILTIQEIDDEYGYIKALGKKRTAEVMRDAEIAEAEAKRDAAISSSNAAKEAEQTKLQNAAQIAETQKELDVRKAQYDAEVNRQRALAEQAGKIASAEAQQRVVTAQREVALAEATRKEQLLVAEVIKPAEASKTAAIAKAEGERAAAEQAAEAQIKTAEAQASAIRARGEAEAGAIKAKLLAEAEGILKKAEAYKQLSEAGQMLQLMEQLQVLVPAALHGLAPVMAEIAKPFASVDRISLVDIGGNGQNAGSIGKFAQTVPLVLTQLIETMKALGLDPMGLMALLQVREESSINEVLIPSHATVNSDSPSQG